MARPASDGPIERAEAPGKEQAARGRDEILARHVVAGLADAQRIERRLEGREQEEEAEQEDVGQFRRRDRS